MVFQQFDQPRSGPVAPFQWSAGAWFVNETQQLGLRTATALRHHAASARFPSFSNRGKDLVLQPPGFAQWIPNLVMTNSLPWYRWPIEIDGLPISSMVIFHGYVK